MSRNLVIHALFIFVMLLAFSPYHALQRASLQADDASYLAHGFTLGLDYNFQYKDNVADWKSRGGAIAAHPTGPGILAAPFISAFSLIDRIQHHPVIDDHHQYAGSWSYFGFVFASIFYFIIGICLYAKSLTLLNLRLSPTHLIFLATSFGILYYVLFRPVMGHSFEFFSLALCFWGTVKSLDAKRFPYLPLLIAALGCALTIQIRPAALNVIWLPLIVISFYAPKQALSKSARFGLALLLSYLPFALINYRLYGAAYPSFAALYGSGHGPIPPMHSLSDVFQVLGELIIRTPNILIVLFSSEFGIIFSSSIIFFGLILLLYYGFQQKRWFALLLTLAYVGLPMAITLFWQSAGDGYGYRFFYGCFPLAIWGYAKWWHANLSHYGLWPQWPNKIKLSSALIFSLCTFSLYSNIVFSINEDLAYRPNVANAFGIPGGGAVGYQQAAAKAAVHPGTWLSLLATRTPGFLATKLIHDRTDIQHWPIPAPLAAKLQHYQPPVTSVYLQAWCIVLSLVGVYLLGVIRLRRVHETSSPSKKSCQGSSGKS